MALLTDRLGQTMQMIHVFGHQHPDTDAIAAAISYSYYINQMGYAATPYRLGEPNTETQFLINKAHVRLPELLNTLPSASMVALVDHNDAVQSIANLSDYTIHSVIDHHKLGGLTSVEPIDVRIASVGSSCTLLYQMFLEKQLRISQQIAMLMAGAIMSDTLNLTSPTTTQTDKQALGDLANIAGIHDTTEFAKQLFEAKSDVSHLSDAQLVTSDYKQFTFADKKWGIASIETVNPAAIFKRILGLQQATQAIKARDNLDFLLVVIVDILNQQSWAIASDDTQNSIVSQAFDTKLEDNKMSLANRVSRKKQFVPALERYYQS